MSEMFRKCFQLTLGCGKKLASLNQLVSIESGSNFIPKRGAGHAKWQNIKSTKEAMDSNKSQNFSRISRQIMLAVKKGGEDVNMNPKLRSLIEEAQKFNMPKATIQKAILSAKTAQDQPYWVVYTNPKGVALGLELTFANKKPAYIHSLLGSQIKKLNMKMEIHFQEVCTERGIILSKAPTDDDMAYDKALEDAIAIGAEDVVQGEDKQLVFECLPDRLDGVSTHLSKLGYEIESATVELDFKTQVTLSEKEKEDIEKIVGKLRDQYDEIVRATYNAAG